MPRMPSDAVAAAWASLPLHSATIIDIGGNFGAFSIAAKTRFPHARLLTFEAMPPTCRHLKYGLAATLGYQRKSTRHRRGRSTSEVSIPGVTVECAALGDGKPLHLVANRWVTRC